MIRFLICDTSITEILRGLRVDDCNKLVIADISKHKGSVMKKIIQKITGRSKFPWIINEFYTMQEMVGDWMSERFGEAISITILFKKQDCSMFLHRFVDAAYQSIMSAAYNLEGDPQKINDFVRKIKFNIIIESKNGADI